MLPARRQVYYGKLVKGRPLLVALDLFPAFYCLVRGGQRARAYREEYEAGRLSLTAKRIMDSLVRESPAVHAGHPRGVLHAGAGQDARVRAGDGRSSSRGSGS